MFGTIRIPCREEVVRVLFLDALYVVLDVLIFSIMRRHSKQNPW